MIEIHRYELRPRHALKARTGAAPRPGALIRVQGGHADIHPWPELGDAPLDEQLVRLARGETTPLTRASLRMAKIDAAARAAGRSLLADRTIPVSHHLVVDLDAPFDPAALSTQGFDRVKIKLGRDLAREL